MRSAYFVGQNKYLSLGGGGDPMPSASPTEPILSLLLSLENITWTEKHSSLI